MGGDICGPRISHQTVLKASRISVRSLTSLRHHTLQLHNRLGNARPHCCAIIVAGIPVLVCTGLGYGSSGPNVSFRRFSSARPMSAKMDDGTKITFVDPSMDPMLTFIGKSE
jgi:hypothetical protein